MYVCRALIVSPALPITRPTMLFGQSTVAVALLSCDVVCGPAGCAAALSMVVQLQYSFLERMRDAFRHAYGGMAVPMHPCAVFLLLHPGWVQAEEGPKKWHGRVGAAAVSVQHAQHQEQEQQGAATAPRSALKDSLEGAPAPCQAGRLPPNS